MSSERKGILKRPATAPRPFFSFTRDMLSISRLLGPGGQPGGATPGISDGERGVLKRAHFIVPEMRVVYPISNTTAPSNTAQSEARLEIDAAERLRRETEQQQGWTAARVEELYRDVCKLRDERAHPTITAQIRATPNAPRVLDLSHTRFTFDGASALADLLALDWGLQRLVLSDCDLDDLTLKPILHALLIPDSLPYLALADNKRLRFTAFKMISTFLTRAHALEFIDLSLNAMDKRSVESILAVLPPAPPNPPPAPTPRMSRTPSLASIDASTPTIQFSNPFDSSAAGKGAVRPSIDTSVPRRVRDPARYPESPGAGPSSPRGSVSSPLVGSPRASISSIGSQSTPRAGSPVDKSGSSLGGGSWQGSGQGKKKRLRRALVGVRLDECALRGPGLEALAHAIRTSQIQTVSLRANRIGQAGAVALALMMKDYPDQLAGGTSISVPSSSISGPSSSVNSNAGLGLGLGTGPSSTPASSAPPSPRPAVPSLSNAGAPSGGGLAPSNASTQSSATGHSSLTGHSNTASTLDSSGRPNMQSHSSLTTVSTFREHDISASPPPVRASLVGGVNGATSVSAGGVGGQPKAGPPVVAPKPSRLQARLAGAVASGSRTASPAGSRSGTPPPSTTQVQTHQATGQMASQHPPPPPHPSSTIKTPLMPPPRHPASHPAPPVPGTNYTAYVPRVRRAAGGSVSGNITGTPQPGTPTPLNGQAHTQPGNGAVSGTGTIPVPYVPRQTPLSVRLQNAARAAAGTPPAGARPSSSGSGSGPGGASAVTMITSSSFGGVTTRLPNVPAAPSGVSSGSTVGSGAGGGSVGGTGAGAGAGTSAALMDIVRSMEGVPKLGCLVVLDLKGNDLRGGVSYIAQVLKRNRTLRSLNLSENKIEVQGLVLLAEALKYNSTLTSLDLSNNPCSSPSLEGIHVLRNALTLNTTLHHLSLSTTSLTPQGAIALAEFLPDFPALQHLDLTSNALDVAGVLALSVGLKVNYGMRCLDLSIMPGEEEMARLCREILKICLRNTEKAQAAEQARAGKVAEGMLSPMLEDVPVPSITGSGTSGGGVWDPIEHSALARDAHVNINATTAAGVDPAGRIGVWKMTPAEVMSAARASADEFAAGERGEEGVKRAKEVRAVLVEMIRTERDEGVLGEMLVLNDALASVLGADASAGTGTGVGATVERKEEGREEGIRKDMGLGLSIDGGEVKQDIAPEAEGDGEGDGDGEGSPAENLSRSWVAEEGEILRKGRVLLSYNELESESGADGEALRQELLEAQVERAPARIVEEQEEEPPAAEPPQPEEVDEVEEERA